ncbi:MAG: AAA family ATPase [Candidatus Eisenbacteria bacterium]|uniref:AAA family ATPase n=1 Tax=Eiseniibacteriota bacterium TaxID=2212470 RepID=A0A956M185_UNCEI|nr:AAA family ATPase [Candidatus Eisenbacteria bacterium]
MQTDIQMRETVDLRNYLSLLWRRKWMVIVPTLVAGIAGFVITMPKIMRPLYRCSATLLIEQPANLTRDLEGLVASTSLQERLARLDSQVQSNEFLTQIIDNTGMRDDVATRRWAERNQKKYPDMTVDELVDLKLLRYLRQSIRIRAGAANQIEVAAVDYFPDRCYALVRNLSSAIIEANRSVQLEQLRTTAAFSNSQLLDYKRRLDEAEDRLETFKKSQANRDARPGLVDAGNLSRVQELRRQAADDEDRYQREAADARASLRSQGAAFGSLDDLLKTPELSGPLNEAAKLEKNYVRQSLLEVGQPGVNSQATAIQLARLISGMRDVLRNALSDDSGMSGDAAHAAENYLIAVAQSQLAETRLGEYDRYIGEYSQRVTSVPEADLELRRLEQEVESYRTLYSAFEQQIVTSKITEAYESSSAGERITVIEPPQRPIKPIKPKRVPMIVLSFFGGLILGTLGAFVVEHHDQSFRDVKDTEERLGVRVVGTIPNIDGVSREGSQPTPEREAQAAQALHQFLDDSPGYQEFRRTALALLRLDQGGPRSILITSARSGEGKSTASICLSLTLARELPHERVVLVDLDARKPMLSDRLGLDVEKPLEVATMLREQRWNDAALRNGILPNLTLLPMAPVREGAGELIAQERVRWLLGQLRERYDRIIIDSPPNLPVPDPLVLGPEVDAVLMVVKAGSTPRQTVRRSLDLQRSFKDNVYGILMNNVSEALPYYYSYKHYGYGYGKKAR